MNPRGDGASFAPSSRYFGITTARFVRADGTIATYLRRRPIPAPDAHATLRVRTVREGERVDTLAGQDLGDPEAYWRICDANAALDPAELETPGTRVRITLPAGVPGAPDA